GNSDLRGAVQFETGANELSPVGEYMVTPAIGNLTSKNYHFEFVPGKMYIDKALLQVWADTLTKNYGALNPALTYRFTGFKNNEDAISASLLGMPVLSTTAQDSSNVGVYDIAIANGDLSAQNYDFQVNASRMNITKAPLRVIADSKTRIYGDANPPLTFTYNGFVLGQSLATSGVAGSPVLTTAAIPTSKVGAYDIVPANGNLQSDNYEFVYENSSLSVTPALLRVSAAAASKFYGNMNPVLAPAFTGWKNSESYGNSDVTGSPVLSTLAYELSDIGSYPIKVETGSLKSNNYMFDIRPGTLTIAAAPCSSAGSLQVTDSCFGYPMKLTFVSTTPDAGPFTLVINDSVYRNIQSGTAFESGKLSESVPESIWSSATVVAEPVTGEITPMVIPAAEIGLKFRANVAGQITGVRFYKFTANTGTHTGSLWTLNGTLLATATFADETASGWQQVNFAQPVTVTPGTTYIVSYYAPNGNYAVQADAFGAKRISNNSGSLTALYVNDGGNGLIKMGEGGGFPSTITGANYFVDVVFNNTNSISRYNLTGIVSNLGCSQNKQPIISPTAKMWRFITLKIASQGLECMENKNGSI
ncbi:MAG: MBG domain-containing protein, partial [Chitinophagaceae bacterium]